MVRFDAWPIYSAICRRTDSTGLVESATPLQRPMDTFGRTRDLQLLKQRVVSLTCYSYPPSLNPDANTQTLFCRLRNKASSVYQIAYATVRLVTIAGSNRCTEYGRLEFGPQADLLPVSRQWHMLHAFTAPSPWRTDVRHFERLDTPPSCRSHMLHLTTIMQATLKTPP
ncbi:hypothetical protein SNOG_01391 [Parastagonospora nodorum SN15]|uniref:Uncharacterized protein n=1 Tax=Phaeosphaeria nodorum (strain SN15 / ATCC MYA-4574 / FGSC 10173) TaxID=321614 RepID=Q0V3M3_PHANO|nr:hypothetical protein SNOG_01391 [Parastagonospora nodorum SN15]EAT91040.1 hypothetical protein SNOG_01391 [Parastagonospora nodorum SN15]